jgi:hypothetical protein
MLNEVGADYDVVNVLDEVYNPGLRDAIKTYSQWPTIPQVTLTHTHPPHLEPDCISIVYAIVTGRTLAPNCAAGQTVSSYQPSGCNDVISVYLSIYLSICLSIYLFICVRADSSFDKTSLACTQSRGRVCDCYCFIAKAETLAPALAFASYIV